MAEDFSQFAEVEDFSQFPEVTEEKTLSGLGENLATDATNLGGAVADMVLSPLDTAGAVTDLAVTVVATLYGQIPTSSSGTTHLQVATWYYGILIILDVAKTTC